ncbi:hypothetical protein J6590_044778 [Homalodisca vitripennis]|nr:hypothetical protein J6590_044778 [Homalodisca vitripennis]
MWPPITLSFYVLPSRTAPRPTASPRLATGFVFLLAKLLDCVGYNPTELSLGMMFIPFVPWDPTVYAECELYS